jgi:catechol 2,3-dioxygenase-like lactoylglutathione lyase family enzyme
MQVRGILETALYVTDVRRSAEFYQRLFGFPIIFESDRLYALGVAGRDVLLLFLRGATTEPLALPGGVIPAHDGSGEQHFAFSIDAADVDGWRKKLAAEGVPIEGEMHWSEGVVSLYFRDPDRNLAELMTPGWWKLDTAPLQ